jgi:hypothetical protein
MFARLPFHHSYLKEAMLRRPVTSSALPFSGESLAPPSHLVLRLVKSW